MYCAHMNWSLALQHMPVRRFKSPGVAALVQFGQWMCVVHVTLRHARDLGSGPLAGIQGHWALALPRRRRSALPLPLVSRCPMGAAVPSPARPLPSISRQLHI